MTTEQVLKLAKEEVQRVLRRRAHSWQMIDPDDIAQEVWEHLLRNPEALKTHPNPAGYVRLVARNRALDSARQARRALPADFEGSDSEDEERLPSFGWVTEDPAYASAIGNPEEEVLREETFDEWEGACLEALSVLPEWERDVAVLWFLQGLSSVEAGEVLGISDGTVRQRLRRARRRLSDPHRALLRGWRAYHYPEAKRPLKTTLKL